MMTEVSVRRAFPSDVDAILHIYNQGIEDRIATLEEDMKDSNYMRTWFAKRGERYAVLVSEVDNQGKLDGQFVDVMAMEKLL